VNDRIELFANPWVRVTIEEALRLVRVERTAQRMTHEGLATITPVSERFLPRSGRGKQRLLLDTRLAPLLADDELERQMVPSTEVLLSGFERRAVLVSTAVGRLQASRVSRLRGDPAPIFDDEAAALAFLLA
jgi:hypothetical protein